MDYWPLLTGNRQLSSTIVEDALQIGPFLQNKPNFKIGKMNANVYYTKVYGNETAYRRGKNKPNTKPNKANFQEAKINITLCPTGNYQNQPLRPLPENKPKQTQFQKSLDAWRFSAKLRPSSYFFAKAREE